MTWSLKHTKQAVVFTQNLKLTKQAVIMTQNLKLIKRAVIMTRNLNFTKQAVFMIQTIKLTKQMSLTRIILKNRLHLQCSREEVIKIAFHPVHVLVCRLTEKVTAFTLCGLTDGELSLIHI